MKEIKIEKRGLIIEGESKGWYVLIQSLDGENGDYLVLVIPPSQRNDFSGYDDWVENIDSLQRYFSQSGWNVLWEDDPGSQVKYWPELEDFRSL